MLKLIFLIFIFSSCAQRVKTPINRFFTPEAVGGGVEIETREAGFSVGVFDFEDDQTDNPLIMSTTTDQEFYFGLGVSHNIDFFIRVPKQSSSMLGLKVQLMGAPKKARGAGHQMAFTLGMGSERDQFDSEVEIDLKSDVQDYSLLHGYRFNNMFLLYDGISISTYEFEGTISNPGSLENNKLDYTASNIINVFIGGEFGGESFNLKTELAAQKIKWSNTEEKTFYYFGYALTARF